MLVVLLVVLLGVAATQTQARARAPQAASRVTALCPSGVTDTWGVASATFKVVRSGTWTLGTGGPHATATEKDAITYAGHHPRFSNQALMLDEACSPWQLIFNSFVVPGVQDLSGQWSQPASFATPTQGVCRAHRVATAGNTDPFTFYLVPPNGIGAGVFFKNHARHVKLVVRVVLGYPGLTCKTPFGDGSFDYPLFGISSTVVTLSPRMLERNRSFTLRFSGSGTRTKPWYPSPYVSGREHFDVTWTGTFRFRAAGCQRQFFLTGQVSKC